MRALSVAAFGAAAVILTVAAAVASPAGLFVWDGGDYPIHYDGPMVDHGSGPLGPDRLPAFDVTYHGGPIQPTTTSYTIFWRPAGTHMSATYQPLIDRFLRDVGGTQVYAVATAYSGSNGQVQNASTFGGTWTDTSPYPSRLNDKAFRKEIAKAIAANGWPAGLSAQFFLFTAKGAIRGVNYCAYHSAFTLKESGQPVIYGFIPYVGFLRGCNPPYGISPNGDVAADGSIISLSHEQMEAVTDPLLDAWYDPRWGEVADICIFSYGLPYGSGGANAVLHKHPYFLQEVWSQPMQGCQPSL